MIFRKIWVFQIIINAILLLPLSAFGADAGHVDVMRLEGVINPVVASYIERGITSADKDGARALVIEMNTPGGLDTSMRDIIAKIMDSKTPVIVYVSPQGSRAASAGAFIATASHVAAMAPHTSIGSAHPVAMGDQQPDATMSEKITNDAVSYIKGLAQKRGRNLEWAEKMVRESANATEAEALNYNAIDLIAEDLPTLLKEIDGKAVEVPGGTVTLQTSGARIDRIDMSFIEGILHAISDPNIAYILMILGINGLIFELANPGSILPGVVGGICLLLAFFAMGTLPINMTGLLLIVLSFILFLAEVKVQSHGLLLAGGIVALLLGSMILINSAAPYLAIPWTTILAVVVTTSAFFILVIAKAAGAMHRRAATGREVLIGAAAEARTELNPEGTVFFDGERWEATALDGPVQRGERVRIVDRRGLKLIVRRGDETGIVTRSRV